MWRMYRKLLSNEDGLALLLTIMTVSLLIVITLKINNIAREELIAATNYKDSVELSAIVYSGINIAQAMLEKDGQDNVYDSGYDSWARLSQEGFSSMFSRGTLNLDIEDLSGKFQINSLVSKAPDPENQEEPVADRSKEVFIRLLLLGPFQIEEESLAIEIADAVIDWIDSDDRESDFGAENNYYQSLEPAYDCKNAPIEFVEELLLVKGITREILFGASGNGGLSNYITAYGNNGKLNINSSDSLVLVALDSNMTQELAESMIEFRTQEENRPKLANSSWYSNISTWPGDVIFDQRLVTTMSSYFKIVAKGTIGMLTKKTHAVVQRNIESEEMISLLSRKVE